MGADSLTTAMVIEEIAKGDMGVAVVMAQTLKLAQIFQKAMTTGQREKYLSRFRDDSRCLLAIGITEPETGSNYFIPNSAPFQTRAHRSQGGWTNKRNEALHFKWKPGRTLSCFRADREGREPVRWVDVLFLIERARRRDSRLVACTTRWANDWPIMPN